MIQNGKRKVLLEWRKNFIPRIAFKMKRRWVSKPLWMGGFHLTMIGREMDRWIFSSSSLVFRTKEIIDWWKLEKEIFPFIFIGQGKEVQGRVLQVTPWIYISCLCWRRRTCDLERSFGKEEVSDWGENVTHRTSFLFLRCSF